jgi:hypothetical protein
MPNVPGYFSEIDELDLTKMTSFEGRVRRVSRFWENKEDILRLQLSLRSTSSLNAHHQIQLGAERIGGLTNGIFALLKK